VSLRPVEEADLPLVSRFLHDHAVTGEFEWFGFRVQTAKELERRWHEDGLLGADDGYLVLALEDGSCAGWLNWRNAGHFGNFEIGISLFPEHRGNGFGTEAQRQLVEYLFGTTTAHRIQAGTEVDNIAEQRALERVGFRREGVQRGVHFRDGSWRDGVMYGLLRTDSPNDSLEGAK
jgi:RimJ/RimL family protein N-acetyltransferase